MKSIKPDRISILISPRGGGKSTLIQDILYQLRKQMPVVVAMSPTESSNHAYREIIPDSYIYGDFETSTMEMIMNRQIKKVEQYEDPYGPFEHDGKRYAHNPFIAVILDDAMANKSTWKTKIVRDVFLNGRHRKIFMVFAVQYLMDLSIELRSNVDYVWALAEDSFKNKQRLYENFFSMFPNFDMFRQVMDQCTEDFGCLVLDKTIKSNKIEDKCFYYKAKFHPPFRMGCWQLWEYDRLRNRANNHDGDDNGYDSDDAVEAVQKGRNKTRPKITVVREEPPPAHSHYDQYAQPSYDYRGDYDRDGYGPPARNPYGYGYY